MKKLLAYFVAFVLFTNPALACTTKYAAGAQSSYTAAFGGSDITSLPEGDSVLSSATALANQTNADTYMSISIKLSGLSSAGYTGFVSVYVLSQNQDGSTFGDGTLTAGTQAAYVPTYPPACTATYTGATVTKIATTCDNIPIPFGPVSFVIYNFTFNSSTGTALGTTNVVDYKTYNLVCS